jgi:hypothetical protein
VLPVLLFRLCCFSPARSSCFFWGPPGRPAIFRPTRSSCYFWRSGRPVMVLDHQVVLLFLATRASYPLERRGSSVIVGDEVVLLFCGHQVVLLVFCPPGRPAIFAYQSVLSSWSNEVVLLFCAISGRPFDLWPPPCYF